MVNRPSWVLHDLDTRCPTRHPAQHQVLDPGFILSTNRRHYLPLLQITLSLYLVRFTNKKGCTSSTPFWALTMMIPKIHRQILSGLISGITSTNKLAVRSHHFRRTRARNRLSAGYFEEYLRKNHHHHHQVQRPFGSSSARRQIHTTPFRLWLHTETAIAPPTLSPMALKQDRALPQV